jgi:hypothetical protein
MKDRNMHGAKVKIKKYRTQHHNTEVSGMKGMEVDWVVVYVTWCTNTLAKATTVWPV